MVSKCTKSWSTACLCDYISNCSATCLAYFSNWTSTLPRCGGYRENAIALVEMSDCGGRFIGAIAQQCKCK
ncbi:unnamed protein product [Rotaria sp. Silwood2]|nr:unnamed protein product [Rotaria sp. Silwood2]